MKDRLKKLAVALVVLYIIWKFLSGLVGGTDAAGTELLSGRLWLERLPKDRQDLAHALVLNRVRDTRVGLAGQGSAFRWQVDVVEWQLEKAVLTLVTKQDESVARFDVKVRRCAGEAPRPFDLCLDLRSGGKTWHYFSREDWKKLGDPVLPEGEAEALLDRAAKQVEGAEGAPRDDARTTPREALPSWLPKE